MSDPTVLGLHVYTIGHSNHPLDGFLELLARHQIGALADVRRFPGSRAHPHFGREPLAAALAARGVDYAWIETLGGRRSRAKTAQASPNEGLRNAAFRNYADYMATAEFEAGLRDLAELAGRRRTAMMCAEGLYWQCHRRLVSDRLVAAGAAVEHIMPNGALKPHVVTQGARFEHGRVQYPAHKLFDES
jgi:uncharacterized protein (DUF488 family)